MDTCTAKQVDNGLASAISIAGGQSALGRKIRRSQATVWEWQQKGAGVSARDAVAIEKATGVPAEQLNPDILDYVNMRRIKVRALP